MKTIELPIWGRIAALKPYKSSAKTPRGVLRAVKASGAHMLSGPTTARLPRKYPDGVLVSRLALTDRYASGEPELPPRQAVCEHILRSRLWTQDERDERRAAHDPVFGREFRRLRAAKAEAAAKAATKAARTRAVVLHIAECWHHTVRPLWTSKYAGVLWGRGPFENVEWNRYSKRYKFPCKYMDAGAIEEVDGRIILSPTRGNTVVLPLIPAGLAKRIDLSAPHPVGLFAVSVDGQPGVVACMAASHGDKKWHVAGFAVAGHLVPECVARGSITLADIQSEQNAETQRIMIERFGFDRYLAESGAVPVQEDEFGRLYELPGGAVKLARLLNSTPNPDGSVNEYFLPVPSSMQTAHEAVAWSFGCTVDEYQPALQS